MGARLKTWEGVSPTVKKLDGEAVKIYKECYRITGNEQIAEYMRNVWGVDIGDRKLKGLSDEDLRKQWDNWQKEYIESGDEEAFNYMAKIDTEIKIRQGG